MIKLQLYTKQDRTINLRSRPIKFAVIGLEYATPLTEYLSGVLSEGREVTLRKVN